MWTVLSNLVLLLPLLRLAPRMRAAWWEFCIIFVAMIASMLYHACRDLFVCLLDDDVLRKADVTIATVGCLSVLLTVLGAQLQVRIIVSVLYVLVRELSLVFAAFIPIVALYLATIFLRHITFGQYLMLINKVPLALCSFYLLCLADILPGYYVLVHNVWHIVVGLTLYFAIEEVGVEEGVPLKK